MHGTIHLFDRLPKVDAAHAPVSTGSVPAARAEPLVGLIYNPHSHRNDSSLIAGAELPNVIAAAPTRRDELPGILADFAARGVDYIAIDGGDGTVRDVLTCGASAYGDAWPALLVLPSGKTNALAFDLGIADDWTLDDAIRAAARGSAVMRRPLVVAQRDNESAQVRGFVLGAGAYSEAIELGQQAHSFGAFDALAVGVTAVWSGLQAIFGSSRNRWRRGTRMTLREPGGAELAHSGGAPETERYMVFASTLEKFPAGLRPFRKIAGRLRLALFDNSRRSLMLRLPLIFRGHQSEKVQRLGFHTHALDAFDWDIGDSFILDGEAFPAGSYRVAAGQPLRFIVP